ncbi:peptidoglycan-binding protein [Candidatus Kaiserbacteria bacterium]|nr:peptidoglycan-binding protein [Candidatus Kaiserbacteria bacterium]
MRKAFVVGVLVSLCFVVAPFTHAQTASQLQAEVNALLQQLAALQAQLQAQLGGAGVPSVLPSGVYGQCPSLSRALRQGMSGADVTALQAFLAADPRIYPEGTISGYFGALTQAAVQRFQARAGIVSSGTPDTTGYGSIGPMTRAVIAKVCSGAYSPIPGTSIPPPIPAIPQAQCSFAGTTLASGAAIQMYSVPQAPVGASCASYAQTRQCINGAMLGNPSFQYTSCSDTIGQACFVNGTIVPHGSSRTFYTQSLVPFGSACSSISQQRTCNNGSISGSNIYQYASCSTAAANTCVVGDTTVSHGTGRTFYLKSLVPYGESCTTSANSQLRTCTNGTLSGSSTFDKPTCSAATSPTCVLDGKSVNTGASGDFYNTRTVPYMSGTACPAANKLSRKCTNGIFDGDENYQYATCSISPPSSCSLAGQNVSHNSSYTFFRQSSVPFGTTNGCSSVAQSRKCTNGVFNGEDIYNLASCTVGAASACTSLDNLTIPHGSTSPMYNTPSVPFGSTCSRVNRTCTNGSLGTTNTAYGYKVCTVGSAPAPTCVLQAAKSVYLPNQLVAFNWTTQNVISGSLLGTAIPSASLASGSRANAISYSTVGDKTVTMSVTGNQSTAGQCSTIVKVQDILPPTCTLTIKKSTATTAGSAVTLNYADTAVITWASAGATDYSSSTPSSMSATTSVGVASGSMTLKPRERSYTYTFNNAGGSTQCAVSVNFNPPTCATPTTDKATYIYGDSATLTWSSTNADYATATSSDHISPSGSATFNNFIGTSPFTFTFVGLGGQTSCSKTITIPTPMTMSGPSNNIYQPGNELTVSWSYPGAVSTAGVYLMLVDTAGNKIGTSNIVAQLPSSSSYGWVVPISIGTTTLANGQYAVRAVAYTPKSACTTSGCGTHTVLARMDSNFFSISVPIATLFANQFAAALAALEAVLQSLLDQWDLLF